MRRGIGRLRAGGSTGFSPASLFAAGDKGAWYDPSDMSSLFQDSAGTTPVTATGQPVGKMLDKSGNGIHMLQATSSSRPIYTVAGSLAYLVPDTLDDFMSAAGIAAGKQWAQPFQMFGAGKFNNSLSSIGNMFDGSTRQIIGATSSPNYRAYQGVTLLTGTRVAGDTSVLSALFNGASSSLQVNNEVATVGDAGTLGAASTLFLFCDNLTTSQFFDGRFYGGIVLGRTATVGELASIKTYLGAKAGLSL